MADKIKDSVVPILVSAVLWIVRWKCFPVGVFQDIGWFLFFTTFLFRYHVQWIIEATYDAYFSGGLASSSLWVTTIILVNVLSINFFIWPTMKPEELAQVRRHPNSGQKLRHMTVPESRLQPMLFPSQVFHKRRFPKVHSFSYSYLMVGIPIGWRGSIGTFLSADIKSLPWLGRTPPAAWFSVESANHLARGDSVHGLQGKLEDYLSSIVRCSKTPHSESFVDLVV